MDTFAGGRYNRKVLMEAKILYRSGKAGGGNNAFGQYFTETPSESYIQTRIDYAVPYYWINNQGKITGISQLEVVYGIEFPAGTEYLEDPAGYQSGAFLGGKDQIYIFHPSEKTPGIKVISETPPLIKFYNI